jgi:cyclic beta-1,2-glucan synthetase
VVDAVLREDPSKHYARMDFATRDLYRHVVERIARRTGGDEVTVARGAIQLARDNESADDPRRAHVGYYLVDEGLPRFEAATGYRHTVPEIVSRFARRHAAPVYLGGISLVTVLLLASIVLYLRALPLCALDPWLAIVLALISASELAVSLVNLCVTALMSPRALPKLDFRAGIPAECRTFVVVPMMITSEREITEAIEALEVRYLANQDPCFHFALLSDFADSALLEEPADAGLLEVATRGIARLNALYRKTGDIFYLFHRPRRWNDSEQKFIGWERKRGKLAEFNQVLLGGDKSRFSLIVGDQSIFPAIRYVLTLDADTRLPREASSTRSMLRGWTSAPAR